MRLFKPKTIGLTVISLLMLVAVVKASSPYGVSVKKFNDTEFPRVQVSMEVSGDTVGMTAKHFEILEAGKMNNGPRILLPPHSAPHSIDLYTLIDTSGRTAEQENLIKNNLRALVNYFFDLGIDLRIILSDFQGTLSYEGVNQRDILNRISNISFSDSVPASIDGFGKIIQTVSQTGRSGSQKILLIINGSNFIDDRTDGVSGMKMAQAISAVSSANATTFVLGHPIRKLHAVRANDLTAELTDFSHAVPGGYFGGFGADLTSMADLLQMQSMNTYVLQYYSTLSDSQFMGNQATLRIDGYDSHSFSYEHQPLKELAIGHTPENELVMGEVVTMDVDLAHYGKMINAVELNYMDKNGIFEILPLTHQRIDSNETILRYSGELPEDVLGDKSISYYITVHTPYTSLGEGGGLITVPVNAYDDGIILKATLVNDSEVLWTWEGPTVAKGKSFEVWAGDTLLTTTKDKHYTIPLTECNRYQIIQVKVIFPNGEKSYPSRPYEYYADADEDGPITEKDGVTLMVNCIEEKEIDTYTKIAANTDGFSASKNLTLDRAGIYLSKVIAEDIWRKLESRNGYYELLYYIMIFINREEYTSYGAEGVAIPASLVHKLIAKANHAADINSAYDKALDELSNRLRGTISL